MKKVKKIICGILFSAFMCVFFIGCGTNTTASVKKHISECTKNIFTYVCDDYNLTVTSGTREQDYQFDGKTSELVDFLLVALAYSSPHSEQTIDFVININGTDYSGILEKNPYKSNYMCDIKKSVDENDEITIKFDNKENKLVCKNKDFEIDYEKAISIATGEFNENLKSYTKNKKNLYECYLKILYKPEISENFYWYFLVKADKQYNFVIDTMSGNIIANY